MAANKLSDDAIRELHMMNFSEAGTVFDEQETIPEIVSLPFNERLEDMIDKVYQEKYNVKVRRLQKQAHLRIPTAEVTGILYDSKRPFSKETIQHLAGGSYIEDNRSVIVQGYSSSGKTYIACALAQEACRQLYRTRYVRMPDLLEDYNSHKDLPNGPEKILNKYAAYRVLVIDEWLTTSLSRDDVYFLFQLSDRRFDVTSTIFCTLYGTEDWNDRLGGGPMSESIIERFIHCSDVIKTGDMNMRDVVAHREHTAAKAE
jgi:DNA replication protein DnaC